MADDLEASAELCRSLQNSILDIYADRTNVPREELQKTWILTMQKIVAAIYRDDRDRAGRYGLPGPARTGGEHPPAGYDLRAAPAVRAIRYDRRTGG